MHFILFFIALILCPIGYFYVMEKMHKAATEHPPKFHIFCLFGTLGGWSLAFALSPSGLAATCLIFLITISPLALFSTTATTWAERQQSPYHKISAWIGISYLIILSSVFIITQIINLSTN